MKKHLSPGICSITYGKRCAKCKHRKYCRQHYIVSRVRIISLMLMAIGILFASVLNGKSERSHSEVLPSEKNAVAITDVSDEVSKEICDTADELWLADLTEEEGEEHTEEDSIDEEEYVQAANGLVLSQNDIYLIEALVYNEARGECYDGKAAVAATVLNRVVNGYWGDTVEDVIYAPYQFSNTNWVSQEAIDSYPEIEEAVMDAIINGYDPYYDIKGSPVLYFYSAIIPLSESEASARAGITDQVLIGNQWYYNHW